MASEKVFQAFNGPAPSTASQVAVTTGTNIKTMLQLATPSTLSIRLIEWGFSFDGAAAAAGLEVELFDCTGAATVTAHVAGGIAKVGGQIDASLLTLGTTATGYTSSGEGTPATVQMFDSCFNQPTNYYVKQWPMGREPSVAASRFVRVRVKAAAAVNMLCWVQWAE